MMKAGGISIYNVLWHVIPPSFDGGIAVDSFVFSDALEEMSEFDNEAVAVRLLLCSLYIFPGGEFWRITIDVLVAYRLILHSSGLSCVLAYRTSDYELTTRTQSNRMTAGRVNFSKSTTKHGISQRDEQPYHK